jgi:outer membrane lipoprotein-sorting protein
MDVKHNKTLALIAILASWAIPSGAQAPKRDVKVQAVIDQMVAAYKNLNSAQIKIVMKSHTTDPRLIKDYNGPESVEIKLQKPNKLWIDQWRLTKGNRTHSVIVSDGRNLWNWSGETNVYSKSNAPSKISEIAGLPDDSPEFDVLFYGKDPFQEFKMGDAELQLTLGGAAKVGDAETDAIEARIGVSGSPMSGVFRVRLGQKDRLIRSLSFEGGGKDPKTNKEATFKFEMTYPILNPAPVFTSSDFTFTIPPGAKLASGSTPAKSAGSQMTLVKTQIKTK